MEKGLMQMLSLFGIFIPSFFEFHIMVYIYSLKYNKDYHLHQYNTIFLVSSIVYLVLLGLSIYGLMKSMDKDEKEIMVKDITSVSSVCLVLCLFAISVFGATRSIIYWLGLLASIAGIVVPNVLKIS